MLFRLELGNLTTSKSVIRVIEQYDNGVWHAHQLEPFVHVLVERYLGNKAIPDETVFWASFAERLRDFGVFKTGRDCKDYVS